MNGRKKKQQSNENNIMTVALIPHIAFQTSAGTCVLVRRVFAPVRPPSQLSCSTFHLLRSYNVHDNDTNNALVPPVARHSKPNRTCTTLSRFPLPDPVNSIVSVLEFPEDDVESAGGGAIIATRPKIISRDPIIFRSV